MRDVLFGIDGQATVRLNGRVYQVPACSPYTESPRRLRLHVVSRFAGVDCR